MGPRFKPRYKSKAYYSDINFDLLGKILEKVCEMDLEQVYNRYIYQPLNLTNTYLAGSRNKPTPYIMHKDKKLQRDKILANCGASGGCISTTKELMIFIKAFFSGEIFDKSVFDELSIYKKLQMEFFPIKYGGGYMYFKTGIPFIDEIEMIGHSGSTGSFAFYCREKDLYVAGDVNQFADASLAVKLAAKLIFSA